MLEHLNILSLGLKDYQETYKIQKELVKQRAAGQIPDTLLLVEHPPVFTIGRNGGMENILVSSIKLEKEGIKVYEIDRGGGYYLSRICAQYRPEYKTLCYD